MMFLSLCWKFNNAPEKGSLVISFQIWRHKHFIWRTSHVLEKIQKSERYRSRQFHLGSFVEELTANVLICSCLCAFFDDILHINRMQCCYSHWHHSWTSFTNMISRVIPFIIEHPDSVLKQDLGPLTLVLWYPKCGPKADSIHITCELVRNRESQAPHTPTIMD